MSAKEYASERSKEYSCHAVGNSERFIDQHGNDLRYIPQAKRGQQWVAWDGMRWNPQNANPMKRAKQTARSIFDEAKNCEDDSKRGELSRWAHRSHFRHALRDMIDLSQETLTVSVSKFDTEEDKINCRDGLIDLRTGEIEKHSPDHLVLKIADVSYSPQAKAPRWQAFLNDVFLGDKDLTAYVQRALGYSLTGKTNEQVLFICYGTGANGKGTLFETVLEILGDYGHTTEFSTFLNTDKKSVRVLEAVGRLKGTRFTFAAETDSSKNWDAALIKQLTGEDTLTGTTLHNDSFIFKPTHKLWFQCNHLPGFKDGSYGLERRLIVIPFMAVFKNGAVDKNIREKLLAERDGIFAWLVEGARLYFKDGLGKVPDIISEATKEYVEDNNILGRFISDRLEPAVSHKIKSGDLYNEYLDWCRENKEEPQDIKYFPRSMIERGIRRKRTKAGVQFVGYRLKKSKPSLNQWLGMTEDEKEEYERDEGLRTVN
jgi:putative DNA primase/helicase